MAKKRKPKKKATKGINTLEPIDLAKVGTADDPCFGKLYDLSTEECKRCGDSELCCTVFSQSMDKARKKFEKSNRVKDMELTEPKVNEALAKWVKEKKDEGLKRSEVIKKAKKTFGSTREEIKEIWKTL